MSALPFRRLISSASSLPASRTIAQKLQGLREAVALASRPYFVTGSIPITTNSSLFSLLVPSNDSYSRIRFPIMSEDALSPLINACKDAAFGRGTESVLDPSYRRALVLPADELGIVPASALEPHVLGIVASIRETLFPLRDTLQGRRVVAKLDKLNVYTPGDFFKGHVDTPKSPTMFGTLLVNLPVQHEGGELIIHSPSSEPPDGSSGGTSYTTHWGSDTEVSWVAFFSDCTHEVLPVTSGNRVTLSFNLFLEGNEGLTDPVDVENLAGTTDVARGRVTRQVQELLSDSVPRLCFHLEHGYPINPNETKALAAASMLKGRDALVYHALKNSQATITFHYVIRPNRVSGVLPDATGSATYILRPETVVPVDLWVMSRIYYEQRLAEAHGGRTLDELQAVEVTPPGPFTNIFNYSTFGNEPTTETKYASLCMLATIPGSDAKELWNGNVMKKKPRWRSWLRFLF